MTWMTLREWYEFLMRARPAYRAVFRPRADMTQADAARMADKVLDDMCRRYHVTRPVVGRTPEETAFNDGQRSVVLDILSILETDPQKVRERMETLYEQGDDDE